MTIVEREVISRNLSFQYHNCFGFFGKETISLSQSLGIVLGIIAENVVKKISINHNFTVEGKRLRKWVLVGIFNRTEYFMVLDDSTFGIPRMS
jgi:hypothetical protein